MKTKTHNGDLDALNADIAKSREDIAALAAGLQELSEQQGDPGNGSHARWADLRHGLGVAGTRGMEVARRFSGEIERHPYAGGIAAFGLGFGIAALLFRRGNGNSRS